MTKRSDILKIQYNLLINAGEYKKAQYFLTKYGEALTKERQTQHIGQGR